MVVKSIINEMLPSIWPLVFFVSLVAITLRCAYLFKGGRKFILHKELFSLIFIIYILCLYYILTYKDVSYGGINLIPFKEMFRYEFGSYKFMKNIVGNILLFVPFGYFASYYLNNRKWSLIAGVTLIVTFCSECMQYYIGRVFDIDDVILNIIGGFCGFLLFVALSAIKDRLPKFLKSDSFMNFLIILLVILVVLFSFDLNIFNYL